MGDPELLGDLPERHPRTVELQDLAVVGGPTPIGLVERLLVFVTKLLGTIDPVHIL
jgi:hypothetical protein